MRCFICIDFLEIVNNFIENCIKMPIKKKKSGKKKKKNFSRPVDSVPLEDGISVVEPSTAVSGETPTSTTPETKKKKKKGLKKKMTKSEKAVAKLDKGADKIRTSTQEFHKFINRMDRWLEVYYPRAVELFRRFDEDGDGSLSYEEFKSGMHDLNAPCTVVELHLLARLLDEDESGSIDYNQFAKGLQSIRESEQRRRDKECNASQLILSERNIEHCACCKLGLWHPYTEKNPKYLQIEMRLVTFDNFEDHPSHFNVLLHEHAPVRTLVRLVEEETEIQSTTISIFSDASRSRQALLPSNQTLGDLGYFGGSIDDPGEITLFYDYTVEFTDCPLLLCDNFFGQN